MTQKLGPKAEQYLRTIYAQTFPHLPPISEGATFHQEPKGDGCVIRWEDKGKLTTPVTLPPLAYAFALTMDAVIDVLPPTPRHHFNRGETTCQYCGKHQLDVLGKPDICQAAPPAIKVQGVDYAAGPDKFTPAKYVQMIGRGQRPPAGDGNALRGMVDYAGTKTGRFNATNPPPVNEPKADDPSLVEQLARRLETYADDNEALRRRGYKLGGSTVFNRGRAQAYRDSAETLREAMTAQNKALYQVEINTILERFGVSESYKDELSLAIVKIFMG